MLIKDVFKEIFIGFNLNNSVGNKSYSEKIYFIQKNSIAYTNIIAAKLESKNVTTEIKEKFFLQGRDIIISIKKPYKVATYQYEPTKKIVIPNNFIILRGINMDYYSYIFVTNYLEKIGVPKLFEEEGKTELKIPDIADINLPDIPKDKQMTISPLVKDINARSAIYSEILENDNEIVKYMLNMVIGDEE